MAVAIMRLTLMVLGAIVPILLLASVLLRKVKEQALRPLRGLETRVRESAVRRAARKSGEAGSA